MAFQIVGIDTEFAAATGSNVNTSPGKSRFDNPPQGSKDLVITTKDGDRDPRRFDLGDTYDVSWGGQGGGGTILNAVVVRSDLAPGGGGGVVVFDGIDENGNPAQIIWTPGYNLEQWYADNYNPSAEPQFFTSDTQPNYTHSFVCFASETGIRTPTGYRQADTLVPGEMISVCDGEAAPLLWASKWSGAGQGSAAPVCFAPGTIGNQRPLRLSQQHRVVVKSAQLQMLFALEEALAPARVFVDGQSVRLQDCTRITYVHLLLQHHHILDAEGARCESLYLGDESTRTLLSTPPGAKFLAEQSGILQHATAARPFLSMHEAQLLFRGGGAAAAPSAAARSRVLQNAMVRPQGPC